MASSAQLMATGVLAAPAPWLEWMPNSTTIYRDLTFKWTLEQDQEFYTLTQFKGMKMSWSPAAFERAARWVKRLRAVDRKEAVLGGLVRADVAHQLARRTRQAPQGMEAVLEDTAATRRDAILLPHARSICFSCLEAALHCTCEHAIAAFLDADAVWAWLALGPQSR